MSVRCVCNGHNKCITVNANISLGHCICIVYACVIACICVHCAYMYLRLHVCVHVCINIYTCVYNYVCEGACTCCLFVYVVCGIAHEGILTATWSIIDLICFQVGQRHDQVSGAVQRETDGGREVGQRLQESLRGKRKDPKEAVEPTGYASVVSIIDRLLLNCNFKK